MPLLRAFNTATHLRQARVASGRENWMLVYSIRPGVRHLPYSSAAPRNVFHRSSETRPGAPTIELVGIKDIADSTHEAGPVSCAVRCPCHAARASRRASGVCKPRSTGSATTAAHQNHCLSVLRSGRGYPLRAPTATSSSSTASHVRVHGRRPGRM